MVWACSSPDDRAGDVDQVRAIAWALNPHYRTVDLAHEIADLRRAYESPTSNPRPELPAFIVGIGSKRVGMAKAIRDWSGGRTRLIHVGRLRGSLEDIDYLVTTPAYRAPRSPKVISFDIALSERVRRLTAGHHGSQDASLIASASSLWGIRPNWINVFVGNPLRGELNDAPRRLCSLASRIDGLANRHDRDVVICGGPRTQTRVYDILEAKLTCRHHLYRWAANDPCNPFDAMLRAASCSIVTADSISVTSQLVAASHRTLIFPWSAERRLIGAMTGLFRILGGRRSKDMAAFRAALYRRKLAAELKDASDFDQVQPRLGVQDELFDRLRAHIR